MKLINNFVRTYRASKYSKHDTISTLYRTTVTNMSTF